MLLPLPASLLKQLVDEWQWITKKGLLPPLPRRPCVDEVLDQYKVNSRVIAGQGLVITCE